jgi:hypothetical protein
MNLFLGDSHILCLEEFQNTNNHLHQFSGSSIRGLINDNSKSNTRNEIFKIIEKNQYDNLFIMFGKVDLEWVYPYKNNINNINIYDFIDETIDIYVKFINEISNNFKNIYIMGLHLPSLESIDMLKCINEYGAFNDVSKKANVYENYKIIENIPNLNERTQYIISFNEKLKLKFCNFEKYEFIDITNELLDENKKLKSKFINQNDHHLNRKITGITWHNIFLKNNINLN